MMAKCPNEIEAKDGGQVFHSCSKCNTPTPPKSDKGLMGVLDKLRLEFEDNKDKADKMIAPMIERDNYLGALNLKSINQTKTKIMAMLPEFNNLWLAFKEMANAHCMQCNKKTNGCFTCSTLSGKLAKWVLENIKQRLEGKDGE